MCNNRYYSEEEQKRLKLMGDYSAQILSGASINEVATANGTTAEEIVEVLREIEQINPYLYTQLKEALGDDL